MSGTVTSRPPGAPAAGYCVTAFPVTGRGIVGLGQTGPGGRYRLGGLSPGTYRVRFASCTPGPVPGAESLAAQWFRQRTSRRAATLVRVRAGAVTRGVGARMAADGAISGTVTTAGAAPLGSICVLAIPARPGQPGTGPVAAETTRTGRYRIDGLTPGAYQVEFSTGCGATGYATQWWRAAASRKSATTITVGTGAVTRDINAALTRAG
jgi:hypothetical protein